MARLALDHITIRCRNLDLSRRFYSDILGLEDGWRPPFDGPPGAWLYHRGQPLLHLYAGPPRDEAAADTPPNDAMPLDHIAFAVDDLAAVKQRLRRRGQDYERAIVPEIGAEQIFFADPDGVKIEVSDASAARLAAGRE